MKLTSLGATLGAALLFTALSAFADPAPKKENAKEKASAACGCEVKADGKVCGVDTDCCCTGAKATGAKADAAGKPADAEKKSGTACCGEGQACCAEGKACCEKPADGAACCKDAKCCADAASEKQT